MSVAAQLDLEDIRDNGAERLCMEPSPETLLRLNIACPWSGIGSSRLLWVCFLFVSWAGFYILSHHTSHTDWRRSAFPARLSYSESSSDIRLSSLTSSRIIITKYGWYRWIWLGSWWTPWNREVLKSWEWWSRNFPPLAPWPFLEIKSMHSGHASRRSGLSSRCHL